MTLGRWRKYSEHTLREHERGFPVSVAHVNALIEIGRDMLERSSALNMDHEMVAELIKLKEKLERLKGE